MSTAAHRRGPSPALLAMLVVLGLPALAQAQLFPNLHVKRQRPSCALEDPIYRVYRQQFYGYYPTQWRTFPAGWSLVSPEAATPAQLEALRREIAEEIKELPPPPDMDDGFAEPEAEQPEVPRVPAVRPREPLPLPDPGDSPFDLPLKPPADPAPLPEDDAPRASTPDAAGDVAAMSPNPLDEPVPLLEDTEVETDTPPSLPPLDGAVSPGSAYAPREDDVQLPVASSIAPPNTSHRRKTLIGGLFDTMRGKRRR